jgi:glycosyltransferase involved in cell wall biosynthesis
MSTEYCNLCTHVIAPSESVAVLLHERGITTPISSIPTGVDVAFYGSGNRGRFRHHVGIDDNAVVIGHVGRLAPEKNLDYLAGAVGRFLAEHPAAVFLVVGAGNAGESMQRIVREYADEKQLVMAGSQTGQDLADAYAAMDLFVFSSQSETQGMVLAEAMAAGVPAVALDAPGAREIVNDRNGRLLQRDASEQEFANAIQETVESAERVGVCGRGARDTAREFSLEKCAGRMLDLYQTLVRDYARGPATDSGPWDRLLGRLEIEWNLLVEKTTALAAAARETEVTQSRLQ